MIPAHLLIATPQESAEYSIDPCARTGWDKLVRPLVSEGHYATDRAAAMPSAWVLGILCLCLGQLPAF